MKAYIITTGSIFGLVTIAHLWRIFGGESSLAADPFYLLLTAAAAGLCVWAFRLLGMQKRS